MEYQHITTDEQEEILAKALKDREQEHYNYEINRINYQHMLDEMKDLPNEWPDNLAQFKSLYGEKLAAAVFGTDYEMVSKLQHRDRIRLLLATTIAEQNKCESVYNALRKQLPDPAPAIARLVAKQSQSLR